MQTWNPAQHKAIRVESGQLKKRPRWCVNTRIRGLIELVRSSTDA